MIISGIDWRYMRSALVFALISVIVSVSLVGASFHYYTQMKSEYSLKKSERDNLKLMLENAREDQAVIQEYLERFRALERGGIFDESQRVEWVDAVNNARRKMKLPLVRYHIFPEAVFDADYLVNDGYVTVVVSRVKLEAGLLHEGDLVDLFHWMDLYAPGQLHVSECNMKRSGVVYGYYADSPNLAVTCELLWFTIKPAHQHANRAR